MLNWSESTSKAMEARDGKVTEASRETKGPHLQADPTRPFFFKRCFKNAIMSIFMLKPSTALNLESCKSQAGAHS